ANLQFEVNKHRNVLLVPNSALRWQPPPQQIAPEAREAKSGRPAKDGTPAESDHGNRGTVWVRDGDFVRPVKVAIGLTDGSMTEITSADLQENTDVVIGTVQRGDNASSTSNPFTPQMFGGKKSS